MFQVGTLGFAPSDSVLESCSQFANQEIAVLRRGMCHCQGRATEFSPEWEGAIDPPVEAPHSDSVLSYLTTPVTTSTTTSSSSLNTPVENTSPVPVPAPVPAPIEDSSVLSHSDQENMEEDAEVEDATDMLEEEELARRFNRPVRSLSAFRDHRQVIRYQASGRMTLGRVLPTSKQCSHPYLLPAESIGECQVNQRRSSLGSRQGCRSRIL